MAESFSSSEQEILQRFCTNADKPIFGLMNLPEVVMGALFSRYSRSSKSLRRLLLDEFINNPEAGFEQIVATGSGMGLSQIVATQKAEEFYERVLVGYGDDSVAELGGAHLAIEDVSIVMTKAIEDSRIGLSPLEKSTRYVYFNQKVDGRYSYALEPDIMAGNNADDYVKACDTLFDTYSSLIDPMSKYAMEKFPMEEGVSERAYKSSIRAKVCDVLRCLLPASTQTNMGLYGNGRAFEYMLLKLYASDLAEGRQIASSGQAELSKIIPSFVKRANDKYGLAGQQYFKNTRKGAKGEVEKQLASLGASPPETQNESVVLVSFDRDANDKVIAAIIFENTDFSLGEAELVAARLSAAAKESIISAYIGNRENRRQKPYRAFEAVDYTFGLVGNFGMYRDLHRHRLLTQVRQPLSTRLGFEMPPELVEAGFDSKAREAVDNAAAVYSRLAASMPQQAQYVVPMGFRLQWYMKMNLREAYHFIELRSMVQGHIDYRRMAQNMCLKIKDAHPVLASGMKFVDMSGSAPSGLERLEAEKKIDKKLADIKKKYGH
ncbi:MAG: FAD-dependent thymidylate synthase [Candidatus Micrarchaeia archaeon]